MNPLEIAAMLDKIKDQGGTVYLIDDQPIARNVPAHMMAMLKVNRDTVIKILQSRKTGVVKARPCIGDHQKIVKIALEDTFRKQHSTLVELAKTKFIGEIEKNQLHAKRAVLRFELVKGGGSVSGGDDETVSTLLDTLRIKWGDDLVGAWCEGVRVWP